MEFQIMVDIFSIFSPRSGNLLSRQIKKKQSLQTNWNFFFINRETILEQIA